MIITCEQCHTQFQLDDERIPDRGAKVRCSRCRHAFFVKKDAAAADDPVESAVVYALDADTGEIEGSLGDTAPTDPVQPAFEPPVHEDLAPDPDEESDWEFSHDPDAPAPEESPAPSDAIPVAPDGDMSAADEVFSTPDEGIPAADAGLADGDDNMAAAQDMLDDLLADTQDDLEPFEDIEPARVQPLEAAVDSLLGTESGFQEPPADLAPDPEEEMRVQDAPEGEGFGLEIGEIGETGDSDDRDDTDELAPDLQGPDLSALDSLGDEAPDLDEPAPDLSALDDLADHAVAEGEAASIPPVEVEPLEEAGSAQPEELGAPDDWDFFADAAGSAAESREAARTVVAQVPLVPSAVGSLKNPIEVEVEPTRGSLWMARGAHSAGWTAVAGLVLAVLWGAVVHTPGLRSPAAAAPVMVGGFGVSGVGGHWIENAVAGPLFVISGELRNPGSQPLVSGVRLAVRWLDAEGAVIGDQVAAVAPALAASRIREEPPLELRAELAGIAQEAAWRPIPGGTAIPFHAILDRVPSRAARFDLQAIAVNEPAPVPDALPESLREGVEPTSAQGT